MSFSPISVSDFKLPDRLESRPRHAFNDKRLFKQWEKLLLAQEQGQSIVINQISKDRTEAAGYYRFLSNPRVEVKELMQMTCQIEARNLEQRHVLILGDTTSYNLKKNMGRIQDPERIGVLDDNKSPGFFTHAHLAIDAEREDVLGIADILFWVREKKDSAAARTKVARCDKESYKWTLGAANARAVLATAGKRTYVFDREADNYDLFENIVEAQDHFVIRLCQNRQIIRGNQRMRVKDYIEQTPILGTYELDLPALNHYSATSGKKVRRQARCATIEVRCCAVQVKAPSDNTSAKTDSLQLWVVHAKEISSDLPETEKPIEWYLWSTHPVKTLEQAQQIIHFYTLRWNVEQLFRTTKSKGLNIEATELETFDAILRQTTMAYKNACRVLQLVYARNRFDAQPIEEVFNEQEQQVLKQVNEKYQGKTQKQRNPFPENQVSWATWVIARLGGWKGYQSQSPPGPLTIKRGLNKFAIFMEAYKFFNSS